MLRQIVSNGCFALRVAFVAVAYVLALDLPQAGAQEIPKPDYFSYIPQSVPVPIGQAEGTRRFDLYGDTAAAGYHDSLPLDGIDDRRGAWLQSLAVRFAPWMVRNTIDFPMDARRFIESGDPFPLFIDSFDASHAHPRLLDTQTIDFAALKEQPCAASREAMARDTTPDCRLLSLIDQLAPDHLAPPKVPRPGFDLWRVLYFNFPGQDPSSWSAEFEGQHHDVISRKYLGYAKAFVHPFLAEVPREGFAEPGYELVLQYWLFYPYNDAGNIHEGDWEHINVVVAPQAHGKGTLSGDQVRELLASQPAPDDLIIQRVEFYFHHWVFISDYLTPDVYAPRDQWEQQVKSLPKDRVGEADIWKQIRLHAYLDDGETRLNLHPVIFIGGDNRGLQQLIAAPTRLGRASNGSYPFPGLYKDIGPGGTGELVDKAWDTFRSAPDSAAPETSEVVRLDNPDRLELIPDWERVLPLTRTSPEARRRWAWLVIPIRFGYPATVSPFAGIVKYAETGNLSVLAPSYNGGWNRTGDGAGYDVYAPHRLSSYLPASIQDNFKTGWGFFNLTLPTLVTLPPFDLIYRGVTAPVRAVSRQSYPSFFRSVTVPARRIGGTIGVSTFVPTSAFIDLVGFPELAEPLLRQLAALGANPFTIERLNVDNDRDYSPLYGISFFLGRKFVSENTLRYSNSLLRENELVPELNRTLVLSANLQMWEYAGSLRYNLATEAFQPFIKVGYGLSWYRLNDTRLDGQLAGDGNSRWVRQPGLFHNLLPNTWHIGAGAEFLPIRGVASVDWAFRAEVALFTHNLGLSAPDEFLLRQNSRVTRLHVNLGTTISY